MKVFCQVLFFVFLGCTSRPTHVVEGEERQSEGEETQGTNSVSLIDEEDEEKPEPFIPPEKLVGDVTPEEVEIELEQRGWKREATFAAGTVGAVLIAFVGYRLLKGRNPAHLVPGDLLKAYKRYSKTLGLEKDVVLNFLKGDSDSIQTVKAKMQHLEISETVFDSYMLENYQIFLKKGTVQERKGFLKVLMQNLNQKNYDSNAFQKALKESSLGKKLSAEEQEEFFDLIEDTIRQTWHGLRATKADFKRFDLKEVLTNKNKMETIKEFYGENSEVWKSFQEINVETFQKSDGVPVEIMVDRMKRKIIGILQGNALKSEDVNVVRAMGSMFNTQDVKALLGEDVAKAATARERMLAKIQSDPAVFVPGLLKKWFRDVEGNTKNIDGLSEEGLGARRDFLAGYSYLNELIGNLKEGESIDPETPIALVMLLSRDRDSVYLGNLVQNFITSGVSKTKEFASAVKKSFSNGVEWLKSKLPVPQNGN